MNTFASPITRVGGGHGIAVVTLLLSIAVTNATGQTTSPSPGEAPSDTTRAALLAAERDAQAAAPVAASRSRLERALSWYDDQQVIARLFGGWQGVQVVGAGFPAGAGTGAGVTAGRTLANGLWLEVTAAGTTNGYVRADAAIGARQLGGSAVDVGLRVRAFDHPQEDFFGLGIDSRESDRTSYRLTGVESLAVATWRPAPTVRLDASIGVISPRAGRGTDPGLPTLATVFPADTVPGYAAGDDFLRTDVGFSVDRRDSPTHPHDGGRYAARLSDYRDLDATGFRRVELDAQQYVPLPNRYRLLALHGRAVFTDADAGVDVPFYLQPSIGGASLLRGFREFRFQDRQAVTMTAEYRWEAWWALDGALFVDAGTVAPRVDQLRVRDVQVSYGVGLRLHANARFLARLDLAFSREGFIPLLRFDHVF